MKIISKADFARLTATTTANVAQLLRKGKIDQTSDGKIDLDSELVQRYINGRSQKTKRQPGSAHSKKTVVSPVSVGGVAEAMTKTEFLKQRKLEAQVRQLEIKNEMSLCTLVSFDLVKSAVISPIERLFVEILQDYPRTTAQSVVGMAGVEETAEAIKEGLERYISRAKRAMKRAIKEAEKAAESAGVE